MTVGTTQPGLADLGERDEAYAVLEVVYQALRDLQGQAGLAYPARPREGKQLDPRP